MKPINTDSNHEIFAAGQNLLKLFGEDLFSVLSENLQPVWGEDWFKVCTKDSKSGSAPKKDLLGILREIVDFNNSTLRVALSQEHNGNLHLSKNIIEALNQIKKSRNIWAHEELSESSEIVGNQLVLLAEAILIVSKNLSLRVYAEQIIKAIKEEDLISLVVSAPHVSRIEPQIVEASVLFKQLQSQIETLNAKARSNEGSIDLDEVMSALIQCMHLMRNFEYKYQIALTQYRLLMGEVLAKVWVDTAKHSNKKEWEASHEIIVKIESTLKKSNYGEEVMNSWVKKILDLGTEWESKQGIDNCECEVCVKIETKLTGPFFQEDLIVKDLLNDLIFDDNTNIRFVRMGKGDIIQSAEYENEE